MKYRQYIIFLLSLGVFFFPAYFTGGLLDVRPVKAADCYRCAGGAGGYCQRIDPPPAKCEENCDACPAKTPTPTPLPAAPTATPGPKTWVPPTCTNGQFSGCALSGSGVCNDFGKSDYPNWNDDLKNLCNQSCSGSQPKSTACSSVTISGAFKDQATGQPLNINSQIQDDPAHPENGRTCTSGAIVIPIVNGRFSKSGLAPGTPFCLRPPTLPGYSFVSTSQQNPGVSSTWSYEWQKAGWTNAVSRLLIPCINPSGPINECLYDLSADNQFDFVYNPSDCTQNGDFNLNGLRDNDDFNLWANQFLSSGRISCPAGGFSAPADLVLFNTWRKNPANLPTPTPPPSGGSSQ